MISRKLLTILLYIFVILIIFIFQPSMLFDDKGFIKCFDYDAENPNASLMAFTIIMPFIAILCYFVVLVIELIIA